MKVFQKQAGRLALVGGRLEADNVLIFEPMKQMCDGRIAIIPVASEIPEEVGAEAVDSFRGNHIAAELVPLFWTDAEAAFDPEVVALIESCGSVFFTGGDQSKIMRCLIRKGSETPVLKAIRRLYASGGLLAGSSAGAAIMSSDMILGGTSNEALTLGVVDDPDRPGLALGSGLGFFPWGVVDQHFIARGRIGRLVVAVHATDGDYGFGVDENTALFVEGEYARVRGENGVVVVNLQNTRLERHNGIENISISFLDDGDEYHFRRQKVIPAPDKKRIRITRSSFHKPAPLKRCAFGSYTLHDLMLRLAKADTSHYLRDSTCSWPDKGDVEWQVEVERVPRFSRALAAVRGGTTRYTIINFLLHMERSADRAQEHVRTPISAHHLGQPPQSRLVLLGNSPLEWRSRYAEALRPYLREPVGVMTIASSRPRRVALEYIEWLRGLGIQAEELPVDAGNIERRNRDARFLRAFDRLGTVLITGGNQRRLTQTLTYRGDVTPVLQHLFNAFESDTNLIAVGGAAAALGQRMIAEGDSFAALRFGASDDAGSEGMVMEQGLGVFDHGIVDQNFMNRARLGRLLVACAEENVRYGFGLCEESGLVMTGDDKALGAIGCKGFVVVAVNPAGLSIANQGFSARGIKIQLVQPGNGFDLEAGISLERQSEAAVISVEKMVSRLAHECKGVLSNGSGADDSAWLNLAFARGSPALLDVDSRRVRY